MDWCFGAFAPNEDFRSYNEGFSITRFWHLVQPHKTILVQALVGAILFTVLGLAMSIYIQKNTIMFWWMAIGNY
jgi:ATP-binding cassette subfamily B protein